MRIPEFPPIGQPAQEVNKKFPWLHALFHALQVLFQNVVAAVNGNLSFGDGTDIDNITGKWVTYTTNGTPDTEDTVPHDLGVVPVGFLVMIPPDAGYLYNGTTAWTTADIFLKCTEASKTVKIFVVAPPRTT